MSAVAIITARGGSKRIPRKNIKPFRGKPVIAYSIEVALKCGLFTEVMVSTEDAEIAEISCKYGASVPFLRSNVNADDFTGPGDVVYEVLNEYRKLGKHFDRGCCIYATAPLLNVSRLTEAYTVFSHGYFDTVFPVAAFHYPIWRSYRIDENKKAIMNFPEHEVYRSQDLPSAYHDAGQFYWFYSSVMSTLHNKNIFGLNKGVIILDDHEVQDIDNQTDWMLAELKAELQMRLTQRSS